MIEMVCDVEEGEIEGETSADMAAVLPPRKPKKEKKKPGVYQPPPSSGISSDVYANATAGVEIKADYPIRFVDVQGLVLWTLAEAVSPRWAFIKVYLVTHVQQYNVMHIFMPFRAFNYILRSDLSDAQFRFNGNGPCRTNHWSSKWSLS